MSRRISALDTRVVKCKGVRVATLVDAFDGQPPRAKQPMSLPMLLANVLRLCCACNRRITPSLLAPVNVSTPHSRPRASHHNCEPQTSPSCPSSRVRLQPFVVTHRLFSPCNIGHPMELVTIGQVLDLHIGLQLGNQSRSCDCRAFQHETCFDQLV